MRVYMFIYTYFYIHIYVYVFFLNYSASSCRATFLDWMDLLDLIGSQNTDYLSNLFNVELITRGSAQRYRHVIVSADSAFKMKFCVGLE